MNSKHFFIILYFRKEGANLVEAVTEAAAGWVAMLPETTHSTADQKNLTTGGGKKKLRQFKLSWKRM